MSEQFCEFSQKEHLHITNTPVKKWNMASTPEKPLSVTIPPKIATHDFQYHRFILPIFQTHINVIILYQLFCVWVSFTQHHVVGVSITVHPRCYMKLHYVERCRLSRNKFDNLTWSSINPLDTVSY